MGIVARFTILHDTWVLKTCAIAGVYLLLYTLSKK